MDRFWIDAAQIKPSARQLAWQKMEFYAFIHFGMNTFTDREWGEGCEDPALFAPSALDAGQWAEACKSAGMTGIILTCKHHDGFCLWPSAWTEHSVKNSPWKGGHGDIVAETAEACRRASLKFGVYLSPWDRHEGTYGDSPAYNRYYINQLTELLTQYGPIFCVWLDGACGEGPNGHRQEYDWDAIYSTVRRLQPDAVICVCGPDVRWCGNEAGHCRPSEWSVVPSHLMDNERIQDKSQKVDDGDFARRVLSDDDDLGSREVIRHASHLAWYPAEVNTSIRPGWFYHAAEDDEVKSLDELLNVYYSSVGGNASFLLNLPPDQRGLIHENDAARLRELGQAVRDAFHTDATAGAAAIASESMEGHGPEAVLARDDTYWSPNEGSVQASVTLHFGLRAEIDKVDIREHVANGQRIEAFTLEIEREGRWETVFTGTVVGNRKICRFMPVMADALRLTVTEARWQPEIQYLGAFRGKK